jgi:hypothetical protein
VERWLEKEPFYSASRPRARSVRRLLLLCFENTGCATERRIRNANQGLKNHIAADGLKEVLEAFLQKPSLATWIADIRS